MACLECYALEYSWLGGDDPSQPSLSSFTIFGSKGWGLENNRLKAAGGAIRPLNGMGKGVYLVIFLVGEIGRFKWIDTNDWEGDETEGFH